MNGAKFFFLLSLTLAVTMEDDLRAVSFKTTTYNPLLTTSREELVQQGIELSATKKTATDEAKNIANETSVEDILKNPSPNLKLFLKEVKACREQYPHMSTRIFRLRLYCFLLDELTGRPFRSSQTGFQCNISKGFIEELHGKLHHLEIFQNFLNGKNNSCESLGHVRNIQHATQPATPQTTPQTTLPSHIEKVGVENNLKLKLGDEWISLEPKVSHVSHIYLGTSIFPILTEESRIIDKDYTLKKPQPTKSSFSSELQNDKKTNHSRSQPARAEKIYQLLTPFRWQKPQSERSHSRIHRSPQTTNAVPGDIKSNRESSGNISVANFRALNSVEGPDKQLNSLVWTFSFLTADENSSKTDVVCPSHVPNQKRDAYHEAINFLCSSVLELITKFLVSDAFYSNLGLNKNNL